MKTLKMLVLASVLWGLPVWSAELPVDEIVNKANLVAYYQGDDGNGCYHDLPPFISGIK